MIKNLQSKIEESNGLVSKSTSSLFHNLTRDNTRIPVFHYDMKEKDLSSIIQYNKQKSVHLLLPFPMLSIPSSFHPIDNQPSK